MATDSFTGTAGTDLPTHDSHWTGVTGRPSLTLSGSGTALGSSTSGGAMNYWNASFNSGHYSEGVLGGASDPGLVVRCQASGDAFYAIFNANDSKLYCGEIVSGVFTDWAAGVSGGASGDTFRIEIDASVTTTVRVYANSVLLQTFTGKNALTGGFPGVFGDSNTSTIGSWVGDNTPSSGGTTLTPGVGSVSVQGRVPSKNAFQNVRIRQVLVNEGGQAVASAANITLLVWYGGICHGAPDVSLNGMTTDANGTTSWSIATGTLGYNDRIFYVAQDSVSYSNYTCARLMPNYE